MKIVARLSGIVAARVGDEVGPQNPPPLQDFIAAIRQRYNFRAVEDAAIGAPIVFQHGRAALSDTNQIAIRQLQMLSNAEIVTAFNTDLAEEILEDILGFLDEKFGYKIKNALQKRSYASVVVVDFDAVSKNIFSHAHEIETIVNRRTDGQRYFKRLAFGMLDKDPGTNMPQSLSPLDQIERVDFTIESRLGSDPAQNRFFSSAPMRTADHIRVLEEIEAATF